MKVIDEKGRLFGKINIIDFAILVFVFVLVSMIYLGYKITTRDTGKVYKEANIQVKCIKIMPELTNFIKIGDVEKNSSGKIIGRITASKIVTLDQAHRKKTTSVSGEAPADYVVLNMGDRVMVMPLSDNIDMVVDLNIVCNIERNVPYYKGQAVKIGKEFTLATDLYEITGYVIDLKLKE